MGVAMLASTNASHIRFPNPSERGVELLRIDGKVREADRLPPHSSLDRLQGTGVFLAAGAESLLLLPARDARFFLGFRFDSFKAASAARSVSSLASRNSRSLAVFMALAFASD